jgi:uncharacterized damage-inducible protein DinB
MRSLDLLDRLLGHDAWTTRHLLERALPLAEADLDREFDLGHRSLRETFEHIIGNVETWTGLMNERPAQGYPDHPSLAGLLARFDAAAAEFAATTRRLRDAGRLNDTYLDVLDNPPKPKSFGGTILHVLTHSHMHRGEVLHMLQRLGLPDLIEGDMLSWEQQRRLEIGD